MMEKIHSNGHPSPLKMVAVIAAAIFIIEFSIMVFFSYVPLGNVLETLIDAALLTAIILPMLYYFSYRPFARQIRALRESEQKFHAVMQTAVNAIISINGAGEIIYWNNSAEKMFGHAESEALGKPVGLVIPKRYEEAHRQGLARVGAGGAYHLVGKTVTIEGLRKDGAEFPLELSLSVWKSGGDRYFTGIIHDITERKSMENTVIRSKKLASIGILSAGVAHEILNPLNIIGTTAQLLMMDEPKGPIHEKMQSILGQIQRAVKIVKNLGAFAGKHGLEMEEDVRLSSCFDHAAGSMERDLEAGNITIERHFDSATPPIKGDKLQLEQVFAILISNARDAIGSRGHGTITVATRFVEHGIEFKFCDDGPGIPADILEKVFDPFFTTKEPNKGTGLGLSIAHRVIEDHGGTLSVESEAGKGACFTIFLPKDGGPLVAVPGD